MLKLENLESGSILVSTLLISPVSPAVLNSRFWTHIKRTCLAKPAVNGSTFKTTILHNYLRIKWHHTKELKVLILTKITKGHYSDCHFARKKAGFVKKY